MSVAEENKVDGLALTEDNKGIVMLITDPLDWEDEYAHLLALQRKINSYIDFYESKQYLEIYKEKVIKYFIIEIHFLYKPTINALNFLAQVKKMGIIVKISEGNDDLHENL